MKANEYIVKFISILDKMDLNNERVPGLLLSHAGFGKTSTVKKFCEMMNYNLITLIPSMYSSDDILGLQSVKDGELTRLTPSWYNQLLNIMNNNKRTILFIDEITTCDPYIQGPLLDLIFNRNLGGKHLPENVLMIAAGNYSSDLDNVFKLSSPLINRFLILNLESNDYNIEDILSCNFSKLTVSSFKKMINYDSWFKNQNTYNYDLIADWFINSDEVWFGKVKCEENAEIGMLGFTSVRSIDNSLKFIRYYVKEYGDDLWMRIVGDSLGKSNRRDGTAMRNILSSNSFKFKISKNNNEKNLIDTLNDLLKECRDDSNGIKNKTNLLSIINETNIIINNIDINQLTGWEISKMNELLNCIISLDTSSAGIQLKNAFNNKILMGN